MRKNKGWINSSPNVKLYNVHTGDELLPVDPFDPFGTLGSCTLSALYNISYNPNDYREVKLSVFPIATTDMGVSVACVLNYVYVKWGDGFETSPVNTSTILSHTYNTTANTGECKNFNITINLKSICCLNTDCNNKIATAATTANFCKGTVGCGVRTMNVESAPVYFSSAGSDYCLIGQVAAQHNTSIFPRRNLICARTFLKRKSKSGNYLPTKSKNIRLFARVYGPIYKNNCTTESMRDQIDTEKNQVHMTTNDNIAEDFGYTKVSLNEVKSDHHVVFSDGTNTHASIRKHLLK